MRHSKLLQLFLVTMVCLTVSGLADAGTHGHPEQFPYPSDFAQYSDAKTGCAIQAFENGAFDVVFQDGLSSSSVKPTFCSGNVYTYLYDPTTMSNTVKKISSTQTTNIDIEIGCSLHRVPISSMTAAADAKKATVTVSISDASLEDAIYSPVSIRPQTDGYHEALLGAGFRLRLGTWSATCSARRIIE